MFDILASSAGSFTEISYPAGFEPGVVASAIAVAAGSVLALTMAYSLGFSAVKRIVGRIFSRG